MISILLHPNFRGSLPVSRVMETMRIADTHSLRVAVQAECADNLVLLAEREAARQFGTIGFEAYESWITANLLPMPRSNNNYSVLSFEQRNCLTPSRFGVDSDS